MDNNENENFRYPSEFQESTTTQKVSSIMGYTGRLLSASKGQYRADNSHSRVLEEALIGNLVAKEIDTCPRNIFVANANIFNNLGEKLWYGDIDVTIDEPKLKKLAQTLGCGIYVLHESDGRFSAEKAPNLENYVYFTDGELVKCEGKYESKIERVNGRLEYLPNFEDGERDSIYKNMPACDQNDYEKLIFGDFERTETGFALFDDEDNGEEDGHEGYFTPEMFFEGVTKDVSPLHNYQKFLKEVCKVDLSKDFLNVNVAYSDYEKLKNLTQVWYEVFHGQYESQYRKDSGFGWFWFNAAPAVLSPASSWVEEGKLYLKKAKESQND